MVHWIADVRFQIELFTISNRTDNKKVINLEERVFAQFASVLDLGEISNRDQWLYNDFPGWDSVAHMTLVAALEQEFDCMLEMDDILDMSSFSAAVEIMKKYA